MYHGSEGLGVRAVVSLLIHGQAYCAVFKIHDAGCTGLCWATNPASRSPAACSAPAKEHGLSRLQRPRVAVLPSQLGRMASPLSLTGLTMDLSLITDICSWHIKQSGILYRSCRGIIKDMDHTLESQWRSLAKTFCYRILAYMATVPFTGPLVALEIHVILAVIYYFHERAWSWIGWGRIT